MTWAKIADWSLIAFGLVLVLAIMNPDIPAAILGVR